MSDELNMTAEDAKAKLTQTVADMLGRKNNGWFLQICDNVASYYSMTKHFMDHPERLDGFYSSKPTSEQQVAENFGISPQLIDLMKEHPESLIHQSIHQANEQFKNPLGRLGSAGAEGYGVLSIFKKNGSGLLADLENYCVASYNATFKLEH